MLRKLLGFRKLLDFGHDQFKNENLGIQYLFITLLLAIIDKDYLLYN